MSPLRQTPQDLSEAVHTMRAMLQEIVRSLVGTYTDAGVDRSMATLRRLEAESRRVRAYLRVLKRTNQKSS